MFYDCFEFLLNFWWRKICFRAQVCIYTFLLVCQYPRQEMARLSLIRLIKTTFFNGPFRVAIVLNRILLVLMVLQHIPQNLLCCQKAQNKYNFWR
mgnify:CR=1 FL=1